MRTALLACTTVKSDMQAKPLVALVAIISLSCSSSVLPTVQQGERFSLAIDKSVYLGWAQMSLGFEGVDDGRCPRTVTCENPGFAVIKLALVRPGHDSVWISPSLYGPVTVDDTAHQSTTDTLGLKITLMGLDPYPTRPGGGQRSAYVATLRVRGR